MVQSEESKARSVIPSQGGCEDPGHLGFRQGPGVHRRGQLQDGPCTLLLLPLLPFRVDPPARSGASRVGPHLLLETQAAE